MKHLAVLLTVVFATQALGEWEAGLRARFGRISSGFGSTFFMNLPRTIAEALNARWVETPRPDGPMPILVLYCPSESDRALCALYDDSEYIAGVQVAFPEDKFTNVVFDFEIQGYTAWTPPVTSGTSVTYHAIQQYFISEEQLEISVADRIASRDSDKTLQFGKVWVTGFNKERVVISTDADDIENHSALPFTKQACTAMMGTHYYFNMSRAKECRSGTMLNYFPLVDDRELIGIGLVFFGDLDGDALVKNYFEKVTLLDTQIIVPDAPDCLYDLASNSKINTLHTYFIDAPWDIDCPSSRR